MEQRYLDHMKNNHNKRCPGPNAQSHAFESGPSFDSLSPPAASPARCRYTKSGNLKVEFQKKKANPHHRSQPQPELHAQAKKPSKHDQYKREMEWLQYANDEDLLPSRQRVASPSPPSVANDGPGPRPRTSGAVPHGAWSSHSDLFDAVDMAAEELRGSPPPRPQTADPALGGGAALEEEEEAYGEDEFEGDEGDNYEDDDFE